MRVKLFDRRLIKSFAAIVSGISTVLSLVLIFVDVPNDLTLRSFLAVAFIFLLFLTYIIIWLLANKKKKAALLINGTKVEVKTGDIFAERDTLKVIPFNEYFDVQVDDRMISSQSLHGQYIQNHMDKDSNDFHHSIMNDKRLQKLVSFVDSKRDSTNRNRYPLGTIFRDGDYLLLAFSKFDEHNRAYLDNKLLWECLINMWKEIDIQHAGRSISMPLLGTGITRKVNMNLSEQDLLELLLTSFKLSGLKLNWNTKISIIIYPTNASSIDFFSLSNLSD